MTIHPHLRFNDNKCREALDFYKSCFGEAKLDIMTAKGTPMEKDMPGKENLIMHAVFQANGVVFSASDMMRDKANVGDNISIMVNCDNEKQAQDLFAKLSAGGEVFLPLEKQFWGAFFGMVTDKYGIEWNLNCQIK